MLEVDPLMNLNPPHRWRPSVSEDFLVRERESLMMLYIEISDDDGDDDSE